MATSKLDVAIECLADLLPLLSACATIAGSDVNAVAGTIRLVIHGEAVPDAPLVTCKVEKRVYAHSVGLTATFVPAEAPLTGAA